VRMDELFLWIGWFGRLLRGYVASNPIFRIRSEKNRGGVRERQ